MVVPGKAVPALDPQTEYQRYNIPDQVFQIYNDSGSGVLTYQVTKPNVPWILSIYPGTGTSSGIGDRITHTVVYDTTSMNVGVYTADVIVTNLANGQTAALPITLNVTFKPQPSDIDGDGILDVIDNCLNHVNADQADHDGDGIGDVCDVCGCAECVPADQTDTDNDGVGDACDNCVEAGNNNQADTDRDGLGNACDNCPVLSNPDQKDTDEDLAGDACDNCPFDENPDQSDYDDDGVGDICDAQPFFNPNPSTGGNSVTGGSGSLTGPFEDLTRDDVSDSPTDPESNNGSPAPNTENSDPQPISNEVNDTPGVVAAPGCAGAAGEAAAITLLGLVTLRLLPRRRPR
jgi:hypothetical protein